MVLSVVILIASIILQSQGYYDSLFAGVLISIALFLIFYFKKSIAIVIETNGGTKYGIKFKPSFIEGQDINPEKAREVVKIIQNQIIKEQS